MSVMPAISVSIVHLLYNRTPRPFRDEARPRGTTLFGATPGGKEKTRPTQGRVENPRYHPAWRRRPLVSGTDIPVPLVTGGKPGQVY